MKNLLIQWELRRKTDPKLELWQSFPDLTIEPVLWLILIACLCHLASALTNTDDIPKVDLCHRASTLTNTDDEAGKLAVHRQACIYGSGSTSLITYPGLKAVQPCRVLIWVSRQPNRAEWVSKPSNPVKFLSGAQGSPTMPSSQSL